MAAGVFTGIRDEASTASSVIVDSGDCRFVFAGPLPQPIAGKKQIVRKIARILVSPRGSIQLRGLAAGA